MEDFGVLLESRCWSCFLGHRFRLRVQFLWYNTPLLPLNLLIKLGVMWNNTRVSPG